MQKVGENQIHIIKQTLMEASGKDYPHLVRSLADTFGISLSRVYEISRREIGPRRSKQRKDVGDRSIDKEQYLKLVHLRLLGLSAEEILMRAETNGIIHPNSIAPNTLRRWFREDRIDPKDVTIKGKKIYVKDRAYARFRANYPNQIWHWDSTTDQQYYLDNPRGDTISIAFEDPISRNKNRKGNERPRIYLFQMVDSYSGVRHILPYTANNSLNFCLFLWECMKHKKDSPLQGIPHLLITDNDTIFNSMLVRQLLSWLGIKHRKIPPGASWQNGKVERSIGTFQKITGITRYQKFSTLSEYKDYCEEASVFLNQRYHHGVHGVPSKLYVEGIRHAQDFREPPEERLFFIRVAHRRIKVPRQFHNFTVNGHTYILPYEEPFLSYVGKQVDVYAPQEDPSHITIHIDGKDHRIDRYDPDTVHIPVSTSRPPKSNKEKLVEQSWKQDLGKLDLSLPVDKSVGYTQIHGQPFAGEVHIPANITYLRAMQELQERGVFQSPPTKEQASWLQGYFSQKQTITSLELEEIVTKAG